MPRPHTQVCTRRGGTKLRRTMAAKSVMMAVTAAIKVVEWFMIGYVYFSERHGWNFGDAVYFAAATVTTVGFGDLSIKNNDANLSGSKNHAVPTEGDMVFAIFYLLVGIVVVFPLLSAAALSIFNRIVDACLRRCDSTPDDDEPWP